MMIFRADKSQLQIDLLDFELKCFWNFVVSLVKYNTKKQKQGTKTSQCFQ